MEAAESTTNSSKVIVQCHDPSGLFDKVVSKLEPRLPLSKLHWKSPNRPLRSIDQLNVSFLRDDSKSEAAATARRHQIPGLRQTPFVKIFLARCDERETYKETCRKEVKQWLKSQGISQDGKTLMKGQERHDAYEYIILHVVLPGTAAANQPKSSKHISLDTYDSTDSVNSKSKWTGKNSSTIYDKLRADFSSSKAPFERVAQIRLNDPENKQSSGLGPSELEELWQDFVEKLKTATLLSFDARVSQYEEDIRDREAQRSLPGWNFCTFFVLKEGLARGFENVGLIEDALTVYDELDIGLDSLVQAQASAEDPDPTSALLPFSTDLKPAIRSALDVISDSQETKELDAPALDLQSLIELEKENFPFDVERENYQQRILTNQVSALDFHIYIFTRQLNLLFRQAKISSSNPKAKSSTSSISNPLYDMNVIAAICEKATGFLAFAARALRRDLLAAWGGQEGLNETELRTQTIVIGGLVASWKWSAVMQILSECRIVPLLINDLIKTIPLTKFLQDTSGGENLTTTNGILQRPNEDLALWVGELISMARETLSTVMLSHTETAAGVNQTSGLQSQSLSLMHSHEPKAQEVLKMLTAHAYRCAKTANRINASHLMLHALAKIELDNENFGLAIQWLELIPDLANLYARTATDRAILRMYARCLQSLGKTDKYAKALTALLLSSAASPVARALPQFDEQTQFVLNELVSISPDISEMELPLDGFITIQRVSKAIFFSDRSQGFALSIFVCLRFNASVRISESELTITSVDGEGPSSIALKGDKILSLNGSTSEIVFISDVITEGWYEVVRLTMRIENLILVHHFQPASANGNSNSATDAIMSSPIIVYPDNEAFYVSAKQSSTTDLTQPDRLSFELYIGEIDVTKCSLNLRPATAGVRLDIQSAVCFEGVDLEQVEILREGSGSTIILQDLGRGTSVAFEVPYTTESFPNSVDIKIEAACQTPTGSFQAFYQRSITISLPISVNVQDIFQKEKLFSRFTATPSGIIPIKLLRWDIERNVDCYVADGQLSQQPVDAYSKMPASWIVEVVDRRPDHTTKAKLTLVVQYYSWDELILKKIHSQFRRDVQSSPCSHASRLLTTHLLSRLPLIWTEQDFERAILLEEFEVCQYDDIDWHNALQALSINERKQTETWLRAWHVQNPRVDLKSTNVRKRVVRLSVEIPKPTVVLSTAVSIPVSRKQYFAVGETLYGEVILDCVCNIDCKSELQFEITSQPDTWLVGGKRRGTMKVSTGHMAVGIVLVPQKAGHLLLPGIDVRLLSSESRQESNVSIEIEHKSQAKTVLVIPSLETSTVGIGLDAMGGRHSTIETRKRQVNT